MKQKCPDCDYEIKFSKNLEVGSLISCPCCCVELEVCDKHKLKVLELTGEDWGE